MIDIIGELRRIMNKNGSETFNPATDSLEAIANALGIGPSVGLWMFGVCDPAMVASNNTIVTNNLAGLPNDVFNDQFWMQVILNASAPGTAPERQFRRITNFDGTTQTFTTDAFGANVEANDLVCIVHESVLGMEILGVGTLTASSATLPADNARAEGNNYFKGCLLMPTEGACRFQPRRIVEYTGAGGIFTIDPNNPFNAATGAPVDYIIIRDQSEFVPAANGVNTRTPSDVIGNKADTYIWSPTNTASAMRYLKGLLSSLGLCYRGTVTDVPNATSFRVSELIGYGSTFFRNWSVYVVWDAAGLGDAPQDEYTPITAFNSADATFTHAAFTAQLAVGDKVLLLHPRIAGIRDLIDRLGTAADAAGTTTVFARLKQIVDTYLASGTIGLAAIKTVVDAILVDTGTTIPADLAVIVAYVDELETRLSATRAGYLDELAAANIPADIDELKASKGRQLFTMDFWSNPQEEIQLDGDAAGTETMPSVTIADLPATATIVRAIAMFKFRMLENTHAQIANKLDGATVANTSQVIQVKDSVAGAYIDAINFVDDQFGIAAVTREGGDVIIGSIDITAQVDGNDTYAFQWLLALADEDYLNFNDVQCGLRIWYSV